MSDPDTETVVRRWVGAWNQDDVEAAVALLSPAYVRHDANLPEVVGPEAEKQFMQGALAAFSGLEIAELPTRRAPQVPPAAESRPMASRPHSQQRKPGVAPGGGLLMGGEFVRSSPVSRTPRSS